MSLDFEDYIQIQTEIERILKNDSKFGPLHRLETRADGQLILSWDNALLRPKAKSQASSYMNFMEEITDCLMDLGFCLSAADDADENVNNNYFIIEPDDGVDYDD